MDGIIEAPNKTAALEVHDQIESLLSKITAHEIKLSGLWVCLGEKLATVERDRLWIDLGYTRFTQYFGYVQERIGRGRSQLYSIMSVAQTLLPLISKETLEAIGITRAYELKRLVAEGRRPDMEIWDPDEDFNSASLIPITEYASRSNVTKERLHAVVSQILHVKSEPRGVWLDIGGFYALPDERKEIEEFWENGKKLFQFPADKPEHEVRKEIFLAATREVAAPWQAEVANA